MKRRLDLPILRLLLSICLTLLWLPSVVTAQDSCFGDCWERAERLNRQAGSNPVRQIRYQHALLQSLVGCEAPLAPVTTIDGEQLSLADLHGRVVVLNFWFTTCPPCLSELPALNRLVDTFAGEDVVFLAFGRDDETAIRSFLEQHPFRYRQVADARAFNELFCVVAGFPMNMIIDREGKVRYISTGANVESGAEMEQYEKLAPIIRQHL